jgi:hypothetical protein
MGNFAQRVRHGAISGPNRPDFDRSLWERQAALPELDNEDVTLIRSGLILDELLTATRQRRAPPPLEWGPQLLARTAVALVNFNGQHFDEQQRATQRRPRDSVVLNEVQNMTVRTREGQEYMPDEVYTALGDGLRYLLADILSMTTPCAVSDSAELTEEILERIAADLWVAVEYDTLVDHWHDCAALQVSVHVHEQTIELQPTNPELEVARIASLYRRLSLALDRSMDFLRLWRFELNREERLRLCTIRFVRDITLCDDVVEHIEVGRQARAVERHSSSVEALLDLATGPYGNLLDIPLPKLSNLTLRELMNPWQFLQSLAVKLHALSMAEASKGSLSFFSYAPLIRGRIFAAALSKALSVPAAHATRLLTGLTFTGHRAQDLWAQPLVKSDLDYLLVIPCIHAVHLIRIVETWMRQGGLNLDERGPEFERYCRKLLHRAVDRGCPIRSSIAICNAPVRFKTSAGVEQQIDLVLIVHDTILLLECKCTLWPDESVHFGHCRTVLEKATAQIARKQRAVSENLPAFLSAADSLGVHPTAPARVLAAVLTNSAFYAGLSAFSVPIVDMDMLTVFLSGHHISWQILQGTAVKQAGLIQLFGSASEAAVNLETFINDPPQLRRIKASIEPRIVSNPLPYEKYTRLVVSTYRVNIDYEATMREARASVAAVSEGE